jgi:hypothetical protein
MKYTITLLIITLSSKIFTQNVILDQYLKADKYYQEENYSEAYTIFKEIEPKCDKEDTLYNYILWYFVNTTSELERQNRMNEKF